MLPVAVDPTFIQALSSSSSPALDYFVKDFAKNTLVSFNKVKSPVHCDQSWCESSVEKIFPWSTLTDGKSVSPATVLIPPRKRKIILNCSVQTID